LEKERKKDQYLHVPTHGTFFHPFVTVKICYPTQYLNHLVNSNNV